MKKWLLFLFLFSPVFSQAQYVIYGTTTGGGLYNEGTIFNYNPLTNTEMVVLSFNGTDGKGPQSRQLLVDDSLLFGITDLGGTKDLGLVYQFNWKTNTETVVINYDSINGSLDRGANELIQAKNGLLYGTSWTGGKYNSGALYCYNTLTMKDTVLYSFYYTSSGYGPYMALYEDTATEILYGVTEEDGKNLGGVIHGFNLLTNKDSAYQSFTWHDTTNPWEPSCTLLKASNGLLYGMSQAGGNGDSGTIYSFDVSTNTMKTLYPFHLRSGTFPNANGLIQLSNGLIYGETVYGGTSNFGVIFSFDPVTNSEKVLANFNGNNGSYPYGYLLQDPDNGLLYGITYNGGSADEGVLFSFDTTTSIITKLVDFTGINGLGPVGGLTLVKDTSIATGISKTKIDAEAKAFPNPSSGIFTISLSNGSGKCSVEVYNVMGQNVLKETLRSTQGDNLIDLKNQPNGVYFYRVIKEDGGLAGDGKVVIEK